MLSQKSYVYFFGNSKSDGNASMKNLLGGKGANLCEMTRIGLPVPPGFIISTEVCNYLYKNKNEYPPELKEQVASSLKAVEVIAGKKFGDKQNPLLVSVRSGARVSMPGMMDTILNLGLNDETVQGLIASSGDDRFAYDSYRRFVQMYADVVLGIKEEHEENVFEKILEGKKKLRKFKNDTELSANDMKDIVAEYKAVVKKKTKKAFPENPEDQLWGAVSAVFKSWMNQRAIEYRHIYNIPEEWGTAVSIVTMVYGNMGEDSGTGVAFTRNPASGEAQVFGEYLLNAQGEDVVAGIRTPKQISIMKKEWPEIYKELTSYCDILEKHYRDMADIEFTIEHGKLWMLQCRTGKRTGLAALRIATEMVHENTITEKEALLRIDPMQLNQLLRPTFDLNEKAKIIKNGGLLAKGLNAGPGAASGRVVFRTEDVDKYAKKENVILVRIETSPEDIKGMKLSEGILTGRGGMTSHAALVARQMGKVCIVGCDSLKIDYEKNQMKVKNLTIKRGDYISLDGNTGEVILGNLKTTPSPVILHYLENKKIKNSLELNLFTNIMKWSDEFRKMGVYTNADQPDQCKQAIAFGAEGIGLCRTEHMFFGENRINLVRQMLLAENSEARKLSLHKLAKLQRSDFEGIFKVMKGKPVIIRTLDPPLHEFLPGDDAKIKMVAREMKVPFNKIKAKVLELEEFNPMLGTRGCRLGIVMPEIIEMQTEAMIMAAANVIKKGGTVKLEIMIPLVANVNELKHQRNIVDSTAKRIFDETGIKVNYLVGTMIEIPRAALTADEIATYADFFSFGTNDLTQTTLGISRDDSGMFLNHYVEHDIFPNDPFVTIDQTGVGQLMEMAVSKGRKIKPNLSIGICGEHGGEPMSVEYASRIGLNYVSCSPFRIPIARLAAAQAALKAE